ncbi:hypothetical protein HLV37_05500 [Eggerthellaceae bacterium zg-1084]|uniref:DUF5685 family protein n=1 Tax=Berryella wangjianweii TaxID=2734634 RepID=UPI0015574076|nr:DUF5685 family protein [Berryella wangjianweii]NPD31317.1 hypothetical protein [Berryella wangjianweii]
MLGFVAPAADALSAEQRERYQQVYCGVCHALGDAAGQVGTLALSNDLTFMALVHLSLYEPPEGEGRSRCVAHPFEGASFVTGDVVGYAGDMNLALAYHKALDDWRDDRSAAARAWMTLMRARYEGVRARRPRPCAVIEAGLSRLAALEAEAARGGLCFADEAARTFGAVVGELFALRDDHWAADLRVLGFELGRFIYLMDAAVDGADDARRGRFNALAATQLAAPQLDAGLLRSLLADCAARAAAAFERLPLVQDDQLMRSVLYAGVWAQFNERFGAHGGAAGDDGAPEPAGDALP